MREHLSEIKCDLQGLTKIMANRALSRFEYRAAERSIQVLIEACIGIAKHWSYALNKSAPADAYSAFERLSQAGVNEIDNVQWKNIIGMRNALVHDYLNIETELNIEPEIIRQVIIKESYVPLLAFANTGLVNIEEYYKS